MDDDDGRTNDDDDDGRTDDDDDDRRTDDRRTTDGRTAPPPSKEPRLNRERPVAGRVIYMYF